MTFPPAIYTTTGVDDIVPELVCGLPEDVKCLQFLSQGKVRITFGCADSALSCFEDGVHFKGSRLPVQSADPRARLVYVRDCPSEVSDASVRELLAPYGVVRKVVQVPHNKFPKISTGTRKVTMSVTKEIPSILRVAGFDCRVWYAGQPSVCPICRKPGHRVKQCPDQGKCRRCHQPGHVARQCRRAWGAASATPSGPNARRESPHADQPVVDIDELQTMETESCSESEASLTAGDMEVAASAAPGPISPRRTRSMGKARSPKPLEDRDGQAEGGQSAPSPGPVSPLAMALSPEGPNTRLLHSHREVWEDKLQWEEVRSLKRKESATSSGAPQPGGTPPPTSVGREAASQESPPLVSESQGSSPSPVSEPQEAPQPGGTPPPSNATREPTPQDSTSTVSSRGSLSQLVPITDVSRFRRLRCPEWVWELVAGQPLPEFATGLRFESRFFLNVKAGVPLTVFQADELLHLIRKGRLKLGQKLVSNPWN